MTWRQPRPSFPRRSVHHCVMRGSAPQATGGWRSTDWRFLPPRRVQTNPIAQRMVHRANRRSSAKKTAGSLPGSRSSLRVSRLEPTVWCQSVVAWFGCGRSSGWERAMLSPRSLRSQWANGSPRVSPLDPSHRRPRSRWSRLPVGDLEAA